MYGPLPVAPTGGTIAPAPVSSIKLAPWKRECFICETQRGEMWFVRYRGSLERLCDYCFKKPKTRIERRAQGRMFRRELRRSPKTGL